MVKERKMRLTAVVLAVVMLLGMVSAVALAKTGIIAKAANVAVFSLSIVSETSSEVKVSFNLESGSFTAMDWLVNASDWDSYPKTTGLTLTSIEKAQNFKDFVSLHEDDDVSPLIAFSKYYGKAAFASGLYPYDVIGSMLVYTFTKSSSAKANVSPSDFLAEITCCTGSDGEGCTPELINKIPEPPTTESTTTEPTTTEWTTTTKWTTTTEPDDVTTTERATTKWDDVTTTERAAECKHVFSHITVTATCTSEGKEYDCCTKCGNIFNYTKIEKKSHQWSSWTTTVQPSLKTEGYEVRMCTVCETVETRKIPKITANVKAVSFSDITLNYKKSTTITPNITADKDAEYTVKYSSSDTSVARVDDNGNIYGAKRGSATITCTVTDSNDNIVQDTCNVTVKYSFGQWLIVILLFGWIWY